ncbi:tetratricopeptide repeat protein [Streptomyces sp. NBC_01142]|uniref:hypothetical protein n=1 Tax=Streptomyces sp. NBC_01142 TaxID=2975865 RepID=UPI002256E058|nr:hypothetical protein [Streptomyces sp. NBC_01142]MCX4820101.1 tetratricopeptide repeat protein [Streptomyces sp. NBC_01142]
MTGTGRDHAFQEIRPVQALQMPAFEFTEVRGHDDVAEHDRRLEEIAREHAAKAASQTALVLAPPADSLVEMSLDLGSDGEELLADARANARDGRHDVALEQLEEYLRPAPEHQEARYLRAYCLYHLGGQHHLKALRILRPLRDEPVEADLRERISDLRRELRRRLTPLEVTAYTGTARSDPLGALARVEAFLELAPEEGTLSYLLALGQSRGGDLEEALDTATRGAAEADVDQEQVAALARRLRLALLAPVAAPAVTAFKAGDLHRARGELFRMDPRWRANMVLDDFDAYLALLVDHPSLTPPAPRLPADRTEDLYSLIAESDGQHAAVLMQTGRADEAERLLAHVLSLVPDFPWLNFLYAACLYRLGREPDRAAACAEIARRDPAIAQADQLLEAIRGWQEAAVINPALDEYVAAMESVRGEVSADRLEALRKRMAVLERGLPALREAARTERGAQVVRELGEAIGQRLAEVTDAMAVHRLYEKYEGIMSTAKGGVSDASAADRLARSLDGLAAEIKNTRRRADKGGPGNQLDELAALVTLRRTELDRVTAAVRVSDLVRRFNQLAERQSEPLARLRAAPSEVRGTLTAILNEARQLSRSAKGTLDARDRSLLDELIGTIARTLR